MFLHNLKVTLRQFCNNKLFSLINISGLVIGLVSFLMIFQYARFELSYDDFHKNKDSLYRVLNNTYNGDQLKSKRLGCPSALAPALTQNFPEVEKSTRLLRCIRTVVSNEKLRNSFRTDDIYFADTTFMSMFSFPIKKGQHLNLLAVPNTAIITELFAKKTFGNENPIGQTLRFQSKHFNFQCRIEAVCKDIPNNSHLKFDAMVSMPTYSKLRLVYGHLNNWKGQSFFSYIQIKEGSNAVSLEKKLPPFIEQSMKNSPDGVHRRFTLENIGNIHLNTEDIAQYEEATTSKRSIWLLLGIASIILLIAWVNYINLSTAKALDRAKEVGVLKVSGALKRNLVNQFYLESVVFNGISIVFALLILFSLGTAVNNLLDKPINFNVFRDFKGIIVIVLLFAIGIIISGTYPAFVLSSYNPTKVLKGKVSGNSKSFDLRKGLVVFQFAASIFLVAGVITIVSQVKYLRNIDVGFNAEQLLVVRAPVLQSDSLFNVKMESLKQEVKQYPEIKNITSSYYIPGKEIRYKINLSKFKGDDIPVAFSWLSGDINFIPSFGLQLICGSPFHEIKAYRSEMVLNETGVKALGYETPESILNKTVYAFGNSFKIIGVIKDYHHKSAKLKVEPTCIQLAPGALNYYSVKLNTSNNEESLALVRKLWKKSFPDDPFDYFFLDEFMDRQYKTDIQFGNVFSLFTNIAIFVACLGLFGLSYHSTRLRTKEIGIRKTLGSTVNSIMALLLKDTVLLILIASVLAIPGAAYFISKWLSNYPIKIEVSWWFFVLPVLSLVIIAFVTVSFHVIKTANSNPVESLKYE